MGRNCKICASIHREEYDRLRLEGTPIKDICNLAHNKYGEKHIKYHNFQKHFANHVEAIISETVKASQLRDRVIKEVVKKDIEIVRTFSRNLQLVTDRIDTISKEIKTLDDMRKYGKMFLNFVGEARLTIEQYLKWSQKLNVQDTTEDTYNKIIKCIHDFPPEYLAKFAERWRELND